MVNFLSSGGSFLWARRTKILEVHIFNVFLLDNESHHQQQRGFYRNEIAWRNVYWTHYLTTSRCLASRVFFPGNNNTISIKLLSRIINSFSVFQITNYKQIAATTRTTKPLFKHLCSVIWLLIFDSVLLRAISSIK